MFHSLTLPWYMYTLPYINYTYMYMYMQINNIQAVVRLTHSFAGSLLCEVEGEDGMRT